MDVLAIKTKPVTTLDTMESILNTFLVDFRDGDVLGVASKIVAVTEGQVVDMDSVPDKRELMRKEADYFIDNEKLSKWNIILSNKRGHLVASSGIDESNANGNYILWPKDPDASADRIWKYLRKKFHIKRCGVVITDSRTVPLRWGVTGFSLSYSGFIPLYSYIGKNDIYGRPFKFEQTNIADSLATVATFVMGEGAEQTPLSVIRNAPFVQFQDRVPSSVERESQKISFSDDIYAPLINSPLWKKGGGI